MKKKDYRDGIVALGLALVGTGIWMWSHPAALVFSGVCLVLLGLFIRSGE